ncbi:MAG: hypothetical protein NC115_12910 [Bacteroidales bacterium]|nr:hypothetical protein [Bacteroidales bacterium]
MKNTFIITLLLSATLFSCSESRQDTKTTDDVLNSLQDLDYGQFRGSSYLWRTGLFRGVIGTIDNVSFVVGTKGLDNKIINDSRTYPLPDSLRNSKNLHQEIARRRLPLSRHELSLVRKFIGTGLWELAVDTAGNVHGKISPKIHFEKTCMPERRQKLLENGYNELENDFYVKEYE